MKRIKLTHSIRVLGSNDHGSNSIDKEAEDLDKSKAFVFNTYASIESYLNKLIVHEFIG